VIFIGRDPLSDNGGGDLSYVESVTKRSPCANGYKVIVEKSTFRSIQRVDSAGMVLKGRNRGEFV